MQYLFAPVIQETLCEFVGGGRHVSQLELFSVLIDHQVVGIVRVGNHTAGGLVRADRLLLQLSGYSVFENVQEVAEVPIPLNEHRNTVPGNTLQKNQEQKAKQTLSVSQATSEFHPVSVSKLLLYVGFFAGFPPYFQYQSA